MSEAPLFESAEHQKNTAGLAKSIDERFSQELIVALVGPVGSGVSSAAGFIRDILEQTFKYKVCPTIRPSDIIKAEAHRVGITISTTLPLDRYVSVMQDAGNRLRERFGADYLAEKAVERIYKFRRENGGIAKNGVLLRGRRAYIIDSLKNTEELNLLRHIYGDTLCVIGVFAPDLMRRERLINGGASKDAVDNIMDRDKGEILTFGQKTRKLFVDSDFFACNDRKQTFLLNNLTRFFEIIFNTKIHTPTRSESAMYEAVAASANSACMSRQVGAAIISSDGELISVGWNDVPKFGGGLYAEDDQFHVDHEGKEQDRDHRCFKWGKCVCSNETRRNDILQGIVDRINTSKMLKKRISQQEIRSLLAGTEIDSLIEFSRSIHAEMEAILSVAREGRHSLVGATLYTNTYPCHNCARHIVAAGIKNVYYIQPYDKSLATTLHYDSITESPNDDSRVEFRQFEGVAPSRYLRLFKPDTDRKKPGGAKVVISPDTASPLLRVPLDSLKEYETKTIAELSSKESESELRRGGRANDD